MDASEDQTGENEYTPSPSRNWNPGILMPSGHLCSTVTYRMDPPNECFNSINHGDYLGELREVSTGNRVFSGDLVDPWIFERQLKCTSFVGKALLYTQENLWRRHERAKLKSAVRICLNNYNEEWKRVKLKAFQQFFSNTPDYKGVYQGVYRHQIEWLGNIPVPPSKFLLPANTQLKINTSFEKHLDLIVEWCMCCFSHRQNDWLVTDDVIAVEDIEAEREEVVVPKVSTGNVKPVKKPDPNKKMLQATRRALKRMDKRGAVPDIVKEQIEIEQLPDP